jgi:DNA-binding NtrC family response regulator
MKEQVIPRILIVDDLFGRAHTDRRNEERANLCGQYLIEDTTGDEIGKGVSQKIKKPTAQAVFCRGQQPARATLGDVVENDLAGTLKVIRAGWETDGPEKPRWAMILLDLCFYTGRVTEESNHRALGMPEGRDGDDEPQRYFGLRLLDEINHQFPDLPVVILSSKSRDEVSLEFTSRGALGFLPREDERSPDLLRDLIWRHGLVPDSSGEIIGYSKSLLLALRAARRAALNRENVLIRGERGTGKELVARYIYQHGRKNSSAPFVPVNSSVLMPTLYASELFGIAKRVATSVDGREGLIVAATGGFLFFDEIGDMLPETQSGILRVLEYREVTPVGSRTPQSVDVRFISATNMDIERKASIGSFRSDLLDRLRNGGTIYLPPLVDRKDDVPLLVERFVRQAEQDNPTALKRQIESDALEKIRSYAWPGNVRELRSAIFNGVNSHPDVEHLVAGHIQIPIGEQLKTVVSTGAEFAPSSAGAVQLPHDDTLEGLVAALDNLAFDSAKPTELAGKLEGIEEVFARLMARYLKAALEATKQSTPDNPEGRIRIHPAVKLIMNDSSLSATKAADTVKQLLGINPDAIASLLEDPILKEAYEVALRLRPKRPRKQKGKESNTPTHSEEVCDPNCGPHKHSKTES